MLSLWWGNLIESSGEEFHLVTPKRWHLFLLQNYFHHRQLHFSALFWRVDETSSFLVTMKWEFEFNNIIYQLQFTPLKYNGEFPLSIYNDFFIPCSYEI